MFGFYQVSTQHRTLTLSSSPASRPPRVCPGCAGRRTRAPHTHDLSSASQEPLCFESRLLQYDKIVAVTLWFSLFAINLYFAKVSQLRCTQHSSNSLSFTNRQISRSPSARTGLFWLCPTAVGRRGRQGQDFAAFERPFGRVGHALGRGQGQEMSASLVCSHKTGAVCCRGGVWARNGVCRTSTARRNRRQAHLL